jgi:hypothetical protein
MNAMPYEVVKRRADLKRWCKWNEVQKANFGAIEWGKNPVVYHPLSRHTNGLLSFPASLGYSPGKNPHGIKKSNSKPVIFYQMSQHR